VQKSSGHCEAVARERLYAAEARCSAFHYGVRDYAGPMMSFLCNALSARLRSDDFEVHGPPRARAHGRCVTVRVRALAVSAGLLGALLLLPAQALAEPTVAADLDYVIPIDESDVSSGGGFGIRLGQHLHMPGLVLTPEIGFNYAKFGDDVAPKVYRGTGGLRLGVGEIFRPGVFAHAGIGRITVDVPSGVPDPSHTAFTYDVGAFFDFTLLPFLNIGVHGAYSRLSGNDDMEAFDWATLGAHAALVF
jgi:hypothetical protein